MALAVSAKKQGPSARIGCTARIFDTAQVKKSRQWGVRWGKDSRWRLPPESRWRTTRTLRVAFCHPRPKQSERQPIKMPLRLRGALMGTRGASCAYKSGNWGALMDRSSSSRRSCASPLGSHDVRLVFVRRSPSRNAQHPSERIHRECPPSESMPPAHDWSGTHARLLLPNHARAPPSRSNSPPKRRCSTRAPSIRRLDCAPTRST